MRIAFSFEELRAEPIFKFLDLMREGWRRDAEARKAMRVKCYFSAAAAK
jgi:hypothetical protein